MKKASEAVGDNDETAQRSSYTRPAPVDKLASTAKIPKFALDHILRSESGLRAAVSRDEIAEHMERSLAEAPVDPHARPTIDVFPALPSLPLGPEPSVRVEPYVPPPVLHTPHSAILPSAPPVAPSQAPSAALPRWVLPATVASVLVLVSATIALGFILGRLTGH